LQNEVNYNIRALTHDQTFFLYSNTLHNLDIDHWKGWICYAGAHRLHIDKNLEVFGGECYNDHLGSLKTDFELLPYTQCRRTRCTGCTDDLAVKKYHPTLQGIS
jgi:hypothetical protein